MPMLANLRWERFANHIAAGMTQAEAYKSSGFKSKHPEAPACRISKNPQVAARMVGTADSACTASLLCVLAVRQWNGFEGAPGTAGA